MLRFFVLALLLSSKSFASNCTVSILNEKYNGERVKLTFHSRLNSKTECEALAKMHKPNVLTREVRKKSVTYRWETDSELTRSKKPLRKNY